MSGRVEAEAACAAAGRAMQGARTTLLSGVIRTRRDAEQHQHLGDADGGAHGGEVDGGA